jgi:hypothetical protein
MSRFHRPGADQIRLRRRCASSRAGLLLDCDHCWEPPTTRGLDFAFGLDLRLATRPRHLRRLSSTRLGVPAAAYFRARWIESSSRTGRAAALGQHADAGHLRSEGTPICDEWIWRIAELTVGEERRILAAEVNDLVTTSRAPVVGVAVPVLTVCTALSTCRCRRPSSRMIAFDKHSATTDSGSTVRDRHFSVEPVR